MSIDILNERLAKGEISEEEYTRLKGIINKTDEQEISAATTNTSSIGEQTTQEGDTAASSKTGEDLYYGQHIAAGFGRRAAAMVCDFFILVPIVSILQFLLIGIEPADPANASDTEALGNLLGFTVSILYTLPFWLGRQATPGKMAVSLKIVDAKTGEFPSVGQCIGRYFGYVLSAIPLGLGYLWVAFDKHKQGWHDKLSGTAVVHARSGTENTALRVGSIIGGSIAAIFLVGVIVSMGATNSMNNPAQQAGASSLPHGRLVSLDKQQDGFFSTPKVVATIQNTGASGEIYIWVNPESSYKDVECLRALYFESGERRKISISCAPLISDGGAFHMSPVNPKAAR
jgi:uncharacterized RDD family membrane protein YckC